MKDLSNSKKAIQSQLCFQNKVQNAKKMRYTLLFSLLFLSGMTFAQGKYTEGYDLRAGVNYAALTSGETSEEMEIYEVELNYKMCPFITYAAAINYGKTNEIATVPSNYLQGNLNLYISPFTNNGKNDFRIGTGFSYSNVSQAIIQTKSGKTLNIDGDMEMLQRSGVGYSLIVENTYTLNKYFFIGVKLYTQKYPVLENRRGAMLKFGVNL